MFLFPFDKVEKGSNIVLYGAGVVGRYYYKQLVNSDYAQCVLWVDTYNYGITFPGEVKPISALVSLDDDMYDYLVIAIQKQQTVAEIIARLDGINIPKHKILDFIPTEIESVDNASLLTVERFLTDDSIVKVEVNRYFRESGGNTSFFHDFCNQVKIWIKKQGDLDIIARAEMLLQECLNIPQERLVLLRMMSDAGIFSEKLLDAYIDSIGFLTNMPHQQYWLLLDVTALLIYNAKYCSQERFNRIRELRIDVLKQFNIVFDKCVPYKKSNNKRIVFTFVYLRKGTIVDCYSEVINAFVCRGYEVHLIDLGLFVDDASYCFLQPRVQLKDTSFSYMDYLDHFDDKVSFHFADEVLTLRERFQYTINLINELNPLAICTIEEFYGSLSNYYSQNFPTVYFPLELQYYHCSFHHKQLFYGKHLGLYDLDIKSVIEITPFQRLPATKGKRSKNDFSFLETDIIVITVGKRLKTELDGIFDEMCEFLLEKKEIKWLIVGADSIDNSNSKYTKIIEENIVFVPYENDLPALYKICDIYLNPPRYGGGTTIAWAMMSNLAVITVDFYSSAGNNFVPCEYIYPDTKSLLSALCELVTSKNKLNVAKSIAKERSLKWNTNDAVDRIEDAIYDLADYFEKGDIPSVY